MRAGDLVTFDAGVVAMGYTGEVSCTWVVGTHGHARRPAICSGAHALSDALVDASRRRHRRRAAGWVRLGRGGTPCRAGGADRSRARGAAGGAATCPPLRRTTLDAGVVLSVTATVAEPGVGTVTARDVVLVTDGGPEVLTTSPWWDDAP
ncbi:MAG: hypothetical protein U0W40_19570 [Acidimicrobiia bacterium]